MADAESAATGCVVIPCFNESARLDRAGLRALLDDERIALVLVDDGSTDSTLALLESIAADSSRAHVMALTDNQGKGEAVRQGLQRALASGAPWIGYLDADLATPPREMLRLLDLASASRSIDVMMGSRVALLGRDVRRSMFRHYSGRVFATVASGVLAKRVYDTQCGAKWFRSSDRLAASVVAPFRSRWAFDVELLARLHRLGVPADAFWEEPLLDWRDAAGSRRSLVASMCATLDLVSIWRADRTGR